MADFFLHRTEIRVVSALISFVMFILFLLPVFKKILNIGNIVGMAVTFSLFCFFVLNQQIMSVFARIWHNSIGRMFLSILAVFCSAAVIFAIVISCFMAKEINDAPKSSNTTVIILGCKVKGTAPSLMLKKRLDAAYEYLSENESVNVIVSGGKGYDEQISEAECMYNYLLSKGIEKNRVYTEDKSVSTYENLKFSKKIIEDNKLPSNITLVTDGYHQKRAEMIANSLGIDDCSNISANTSEWLVPTYWVREWFGISYQFVFGR